MLMMRLLNLFVTAITCFTLSIGTVQSAERSQKFNKYSKYKTAYPHKPGLVISPFRPYNIISVKHLRPGDLAYDPTTGSRDPKTGKLNLSSAKIFRVPKPKQKPVVKPTTTST